VYAGQDSPTGMKWMIKDLEARNNELERKLASKTGALGSGTMFTPGKFYAFLPMI